MKNRNALIFLIMLLFLGFMAWYTLSGSGDDDEEKYEQALENAQRYYENEVYTKAYDAYVEAYLLNPGYEIAVETGDAAMMAGSTKDAIEYYELAIKYEPEESDPYAKLMDYYMSKGSYTEALEIYKDAEKALEEIPQEMADLYDELHGGFKDSRTNLTAFYGWHGDYAAATIEEVSGVIDASGDAVVTFMYEQVGMYDEASELIPVLQDGSWQYNNLEGMKNSLAIGYDVYGNFGNGYAPVCVDEKWTYVDVDGSCYSSEGKWVSFDTITESGFPELSWDYAGSFINDIAAVQKDGKWALIDKDMKLVTEYIFDDVVLDEYGFCANAGVVIAKSGDSYHIYSLEGKQVGDASFDDAKSFVSSGSAAVCVDGKWGFVNTSGSIVIEPQYEDADSFNAGYAPVLVDGLWGYIDTAGALEIEAAYTYASTFSSSGVAYVLMEDATTYTKITLYEYMD